MASARHFRSQTLVVLFLVTILTPCEITGEDFILPTLYMPLKRLLPTVLPGTPDYYNVTAEHVREYRKWTLGEVYNKSVDEIGTAAIVWISVNKGKLTGSNFDDKWFYKIPFQKVESSYSTEGEMVKIRPSDIQARLLAFVGKRFSLDINKVASRLNVPVANLSQSYNPANWRAVVNAMVEETTLTYISRLEVGSVESLAKLIQLTVPDLKNLTLAAYESLVLPLYPKKYILDHNTTRMISDAPGVSVTPPEDIVVTKLVQEATAFKADDFAILYNFTDEQIKTLMRTNFHQMSRMCSVSVPSLINMTLPSLSWSIVGSKFKSPKCPVLITIKGKSISTLPNIDPNAMSVLVLLTTSTDLPWRKVFEAVNASLSDWEILDSVSIQQLADISGKDKLSLLNDSVSASMELIYKLNENGSLTQAIRDRRAYVRSSLETLFNLTSIQVANITGITKKQLQNASSSFMFKIFLNATVSHFNITWNDIYGPVNMTLLELSNLPWNEWSGIVPNIIRASLKLETIKLEMSEENLFQLLGILPENASIAVLKELIETRIKVTLQRIEKFEKHTLQAYLLAKSISDDDYLNSTILAVLMAASDLPIPDFQLIYNVDAGQLFVLQHIKFKDLAVYCDLNGTSIKGRTPFNITADIVGIRATLATCKTTRLYAWSKSKPLSALKGSFSIFQNATAPFMRIIDDITGLPWRRNLWAFGVKMEDWTVFDALSIKAFGEITSQSISVVEGETLQSIFNSALKLKADDNAELRALLLTYKTAAMNELFTVLSTNGNELISVLGITQARIDASTLPELLELTLKYFHEKFNVSLLNVGNTFQVAEKDLHNLARTEWRKIVQLLKDEIVRSGRTQLELSLEKFSSLLGQSSANLLKLDMSQLKSLWDNVFVRVRKGKNFMEEKTISQLTTLHNLDQSSFWDMSVMSFVENSLGLKKAELALLYAFDSDGLDVLANFTFKEISTVCSLSNAVINGTTPFALIKSLLGMDNPMQCRAVALAASARMMTLKELSTKFNVSLDDSHSFLDVVERLIPLSWSKIALALNISVPGWPPLGAVSLKELANIVSDTPTNIKAQKSLRQVAIDIGNLTGSPFNSLLNRYRLNLTQKVSELLAVNSTAVCDSCSINIVDIFEKALTILGAKMDFQKNLLPSKMDLSDYDFRLLPPSRWWRVVPLIVADSYEKASSSLDISKDHLAVLFDRSLDSILNMTLKDYVPVMVNEIKTLIQAKVNLKTNTLAQLAASKGISVAGLENKNILEAITNLTDASLSNISFVFDWSAENRSVLQNYTLAYAANYKPGGFDSLKSMSPFDLVQFIAKSVHGLPLPTTPPPPTPPLCKKGYVLTDNNKSCTDVDECSSSSNCVSDQLCQNYQGGYECECIKPGYSNINKRCTAVMTYEGSITIINVDFKVEYQNKKTADFYDLKTLLEYLIAGLFEKSSLSSSFRGISVTYFRKGSVIADLRVHMSPSFEGKPVNIQKVLENGLNSSIVDKKYLGAYQVKQLTIEDYNECENHHHDCNEEATCVNKDGTFDCECNDGFEGDGRSCKAGFLKTMWWTVIIAAFVLIIIVIIIVVLIIKRPRSDQRYGMGTAEDGKRQVSGTSKDSGRLSYQEGDVFYKDKGGNIRRGTSHSPPGIRETPLGKMNPVFLEDEVEARTGIRAKSPFVPDNDEPTPRNGNAYEMNGRPNGTAPKKGTGKTSKM